jgi:hypothetical protein
MDERTDVNLVAKQAWVMNLRAPRPHIEEVAVFDREFVCPVAVETIDLETLGL